MNDKYKQDGVDIEAGDSFSKFAANICKSTYEVSPFVKVHDFSQGNFRGPRGFKLKHLPRGSILTGGMDGVGTKVVIIDAAGKFQSAASNLLAMTAMDITRWGGLPLIFLNILDVRSLGEADSETRQAAKDLMIGLGQEAKWNKFVLLGGETAELGLCVGSENPNAKLMFNWGGCMIGAYHPKKMILGNTLRPGQIIIALKDYFRSNGISSVRKALAIKHGPDWWNNPAALADILASASPSQLYDRMLNAAHGWFKIHKDMSQLEAPIKMHLIVHLSGGAFKSKLGEDILKPQGLSADLNNLFNPPEIMKNCARWRGLSSEECYSTWNGGQGAIVVIDKKDKNKFLEIARTYSIVAQEVGEITSQKSYTISIKSRFDDGKMINY